MKKRFISAALCLLLCISLLPTPVRAARDVSFESSLASDLKALGLFKGVSDTDFALERAPTRLEALVMLIRVLGKEQEALSGEWTHPFEDVPAWAGKYVGYAYSNGLTNGVSATRFGMSDASAAIYLTFILRSLDYSDASGADFTWDNPFSLAKSVGVLPDRVNISEFWRADVVTVSYAALFAKLKGSEQTLAQKLIAAGAFSQALFDAHYRAGVLSAQGRKTLSPQEISQKCSGSVFFIKTYCLNGTESGTGSGFFISADGLAVTNCHVVYDCLDLEITTTDGKKYDDVVVISADEDNDLALLKVSGGSFVPLEIETQTAVQQGQQVYAIGSPLGLENTMSQGIVSNPRRTVDEVEYIQISVPIASGSSGGALINEYGSVIGVTAAGYTSSSGDLNLAIPASRIAGLDKSSENVIVLFSEEPYPFFEKVMDFGIFSGARIADGEITELGYSVNYDMKDFYDFKDISAATRYASAMIWYMDVLSKIGFTETSSEYDAVRVFECEHEKVSIQMDYAASLIRIQAERKIRYYKEFGSLPDFGSYMLASASSVKTVGDSKIYEYQLAEQAYYYESELVDIILMYFSLVDTCGFEYVEVDGSDIVFEGHGLEVRYSLVSNATVYVTVSPVL